MPSLDRLHDTRVNTDSEDAEDWGLPLSIPSIRSLTHLPASRAESGLSLIYRLCRGTKSGFGGEPNQKHIQILLTQSIALRLE